MLSARAARLRDDAGNTMIIVIIVSMVVGSLASLALGTGRQAEWSSASDRNHEGSLGLAEAGVQEQIKRIQQQTGAGSVPTFVALNGTTPQGSYHVETARCPADVTDVSRTLHQSWCDAMGVTKGYVIDSIGTAGGVTLGRKRHVRVSLVLPTIFPPGTKYTLYSTAPINLGNNDSFNSGPNGAGDIFSNASVTIGNGATVNGSVTSAQSYIDSSASGSSILGNAWSGGYSSGSWAMKLTSVGGWAKASVSAPSCTGQSASNYTVYLGAVAGGVTTWGSLSGAAVRSIDHTNTCTSAAPPIASLPTFTYNKFNYTPAPLEFGSVAAFNAWKASHATSSISGTFEITDASPTVSNPVDLSGWNIAGDLTVVTNAPIYTDGITDNGLAAGVTPTLVLVSDYAPNPLGTPCTVSNTNTECAIYVKNQLNVNVDGTCRTATLVYADKGPVAIKNTPNNPGSNATMCGSVVSQGFYSDNNQGVNYDPRVSSILGFGAETYKIGLWQELPVS